MNFNFKDSKMSDLRKYIALGVLLLMTLIALIAFVEPIFVLFDTDSAVAAVTDPVVKGISDHWGKGLLIAVLAGILFGQGDKDIKKIKLKQNLNN